MKDRTCPTDGSDAGPAQGNVRRIFQSAGSGERSKYMVDGLHPR